MAKSGVIYGSTSTFKTTAIAHFSRYIAETTGKATLLFSADGGGWTPCDEEIAVGMIRPYRADLDKIFLPTLVMISKGYWPKNVEETDPSKVNFIPIDWNEVGGIAVEGLTSIGNNILLQCAQKGLKTGEDATSKFSMPIIVEGQQLNVGFAGNSKGHYQFCHNQLQGMVNAFNSLPCKYVLFTGLDKRGEDDDRKSVYGVATPGKAITDVIPTWVGDYIHAQDYAVPRKVKVPPPGKTVSDCKPDELIETEVIDVICRYYFKPHPDPSTGILFKAKPRIAHNSIRALEKEFPGGYFEPTPEQGFDTYLKTLDKLLKLGLAREDPGLASWRQKMDAKLGRTTTAATAVATPTTQSTKERTQ